MKRCKVIALIICSIVVVICTAMIIRINIQFPKAEDKSYTIDNPADQKFPDAIPDSLSF